MLCIAIPLVKVMGPVTECSEQYEISVWQKHRKSLRSETGGERGSELEQNQAPPATQAEDGRRYLIVHRLLHL